MKKQLRILFITPQGKKEEDSHHCPLFSMAIGTLVTITPRQHSIELVDEIWGDRIDYNGDYDLVAITVRTLNANRAYDIADAFMERGKTVVLGGIHPSLNFDEAIQHCSSVVCGEAENLWETLLDDLAKEALKPRYNGADFPPVTTPPGLDYKRIFQLSKREQVDVRKPIPIFLSRGCPYDCLFCCTPDMTGTLYRVQSPDALKHQIEEAKRVWFKETWHGGSPWFQFCDENIAVNKEQTWEILEAIKECKIYFSTYCSMNLLEDPVTVKLLKEAGCIMCLVGFESLNPTRQKEYNKENVNRIDRFKKVITDCRKQGLCVQGNFLANPATDTYEDMAEVLQFVRESGMVMPTYALITPFPGTRLYRQYDEQGLVVDRDWDKYTCQNLVIKTPEQYNPGEYHRAFLQTFRDMYDWPTIIKRVFLNPYKFLTFITSLRFRENLTEQLESLRLGKWQTSLPKNVQQNLPPEKPRKEIAA